MTSNANQSLLSRLSIGTRVFLVLVPLVIMMVAVSAWQSSQSLREEALNDNLMTARSTIKEALAVLDHTDSLHNLNRLASVPACRQAGSCSTIRSRAIKIFIWPISVFWPIPSPMLIYQPVPESIYSDFMAPSIEIYG